MSRIALELWPKLQDVDACIKPEAENPHEAVLLAAHQPMLFTDPDGVEVGEEELLDAYLTGDGMTGTGTHLLVLLGGSGAGKSHLVRWVHAKLRQKSGNQHHIIRIPKNTSLRGFVERVLDGLPSEDRFSSYRQKLDEAEDAPDPEKAAIDLRSKLHWRLKRIWEEARECRESAKNRAQKPTDEKLVEMRYAHADPKKALPSLLGDSALQDCFISGQESLLQRVVRKALTGETEVDRQYRFEPKDLEIDSSLIREAAAVTKTYAGQLKRKKYREEAVSVLNGALDGALTDLFGTKKYRIPELFREIREELGTERELFVLIEDFASLAGVQHEVLNIAIEEGVRDGKQHLCTLRTILAATEGTKADLATVESRSKRWEVVQDRQSPENAINDAVKLTYAYLNAARIGQSGLVKVLKDNDSDSASDWVPQTGKNPEEELRGFYDPELKRTLFPFNREVIAELVKGKCLPEGTAELNPRKVINRVILPVLTKRTEFEKGEFPPPEFAGTGGVFPLVNQYLARNFKQDKGRYTTVIRLWGGNPKEPDMLSRVDPSVFSVFGLQVPKVSGVKSSGPTEILVEQPPPKSAPSVQSDASSSKLSKMEEQLDAWNEGKGLVQEGANELRAALADAIDGWVQWHLHCLEHTPLRTQQKHIYLPKAKGNSRPHLFYVCEEDDWKDRDHRATIVLAFKALFRWKYGKTWSYEDGAADAGRYAELVQGMGKKWVEHVRRQGVTSAKEDLAPHIARGLMVGAHILGVRKEVCRGSAGLFFMGSERDTGDEQASSAWAKVVQEVQDQRGLLIDHLSKQIGARQGKGGKTQAIDWSRVGPAVKDVVESDGQLKDLPSAGTGPEGQILRHLKNLGDKLEAAAKEEAKRLHVLGEAFHEHFGPDFENDEGIKKLSAWVEAVAGASILKGKVTLADLQDCLEKIETEATSIVQTTDSLRNISATDELLPMTLAIAKIPRGTVELYEELERQFSLALSGTEEFLGAQIEAMDPDGSGDDAVSPVIEKLHKTLEEVEGYLREHPGEG